MVGEAIMMDVGATTYFLLILFALLLFFLPSCLFLGSAFLFLNAPALFLFLPSRLLFEPLLLFHHSFQCTDAGCTLFLRRHRGGLIILLCFLLLLLLFRVPFTSGFTVVTFILVFICRSKGS